MSSVRSKIRDPISQMDGYSVTHSPVNKFPCKRRILSPMVNLYQYFLDVSAAKIHECKIIT